MKAKMRSYRLGVVDGWKAPRCLSSGMTWDDAALSKAYDRGVNLGQRLRSPLRHEKANV